MTIHHAIVKSAAAKGVELSHDEDAGTITARDIATSLSLAIEVTDDTNINEEAKGAHAQLADMLAIPGEYPGIRVVQDDDMDFVATDARDVNDVKEIGRDPCLEDLVITIQEYLAAPEEGEAEEEDDEDKGGASVVPDVYKQRYAAAGHPEHCGDWLAVTLNDLTRVVIVDGKAKESFSIDKLETIAEANGVDCSRYLVNKSNGWQGRFRMTVRNILAKVVAIAGVMHVPGEVDGGEDREVIPPSSWGTKYRAAKEAGDAKLAKRQSAAKAKAAVAA
jgi:hypothetical protein